MATNIKRIKVGRVIVAGAAAFSLIGVLAPLTVEASGGMSGGGQNMGRMPEIRRKVIHPAESFREGLEALQAGDYHTAEKKFGEVLQAAPKHPQANYYMGMAKVGLGKDRAARRYFETAVRELPNFVDAREQLALLYVRLGRTDDAEEQLAALKELQAKCVGGICGDASARVDEAVANVEAALGHGGDSEGAADGDDQGDDDTSAMNAASHRFARIFLKPREEGVKNYRTAVRLINQGRYKEAIADLDQSLAIVGPHPDILNYLGFAHRKLGMFDKAKDYYAQALAIYPEHLGANEYLGELYLELGEIDKAKRQLAKLDKLCDFGCAEREELARLIGIKESVRSAAR